MNELSKKEKFFYGTLLILVLTPMLPFVLLYYIADKLEKWGQELEEIKF